MLYFDAINDNFEIPYLKHFYENDYLKNSYCPEQRCGTGLTEK